MWRVLLNFVFCLCVVVGECAVAFVLLGYHTMVFGFFFFFLVLVCWFDDCVVGVLCCVVFEMK
jgi:hypothetical protein